MSRVLVVEDEVCWLDLVRERLEEMGYEVVATSDGLTAFETIRSNDLDLMVLDVQMPVDGRAFLWFAEACKPDLPVIIHTAFTHFRDDPSFGGKADFALKSPDLSELAERVLEALDDGGGGE